MKLKVNELFYSVQGETTTAGFLSFFIRLTGCNLDCAYCDTRYAREEGRDMPIELILEAVRRSGPFHHITVTGGEPLCQEGTPELLSRLVSLRNSVQIETNGSIGLERVPRGVRKIVDVKTPSSGHAGCFLMSNLRLLQPGDELKFVVSDRDDFVFARDFIRKHLAGTDAVINLSPAYGKIDPAELAGLILAEGLKVRLNLQLHKIIWGSEEESKVIINI
ncbi:MAG TPA: radical SAM protein [Spirochaetota bacterium]|nr:radical SAM protein [Spirochaetota bacterium]HPI87907.1 radical SAM protein [Spirochaetota bacterium]HPR47361.1 radical SAM protein [Spirochaetota bacterium]